MDLNTLSRYTGGPLSGLQLLRQGRTRRVSSWDQTGGNRDAIPLPAGETAVLADIPGAGRVTHIWMTIGAGNNSDTYLRALVLRAYWDGEEQPSIEVPLGDFFNVGHARVATFNCLPFNMSAQPGAAFAGMNCYLPMPFGAGARITLENQDNVEVGSVYFYIDYEALDQIDPLEGRLHAQWRRQNPCAGKPDGREGEKANLSDKDNYLICEAQGRGHFIGCNLSIHNLHGGWWGEGDDMFVIDGEPWPPALHGTGSEDYFGHAWGMQDNHSLYCGTSFHEKGDHYALGERITVYRFHIQDPVVFQTSLRMSIEHGHANQRSDDLSSTAYWYQAEPHQVFPALPPLEARLPRRLYPGARRIAVSSPCRQFLVIGPFDNPVEGDKRLGLDTVYPPETGFDPDGAYEGKDGRTCRWQPVETPTSGKLNLRGLFNLDHAVAYAQTYVHASRARQVRLLLGSDDGVKVWINGVEVHNKLTKRACQPDEDSVVIDLQQGWNVILCKVEQDDMGWELALRVADLDTDLDYAIAPEEVYHRWTGE